MFYLFNTRRKSFGFRYLLNIFKIEKGIFYPIDKTLTAENIRQLSPAKGLIDLFRCLFKDKLFI